MAILALTRAQFRDAIRHNLNKRTALDDDPVNGKAGEPSSRFPWPDNRLINQKLDEAISFLSRKARFSEVTGIEVSVALGTETPQTVSLRTVGLDQGLQLGQINEVRRVYWDDGSTKTRLIPVAREELDREWRAFQSEDVGVPRCFSIEGYTLSLYPGSDAAGTLVLIVGAGIVGFMTDADTIEQLPVDYHTVPQHLATGMLAALQTEDVEMQDAAKTFMAMGLDGVADVKRHLARQNVQQQRNLPIASFGYYGRFTGRRY